VGRSASAARASTGITDLRRSRRSMRRSRWGAGAEVRRSAEVMGFDRYLVQSRAQRRPQRRARQGRVVGPHASGRFLGPLCSELPRGCIAIGCADGGRRSGMMIVPFRGEYYDLAAARGELVRA